MYVTPSYVVVVPFATVFPGLVSIAEYVPPDVTGFELFCGEGHSALDELFHHRRRER